MGARRRHHRQPCLPDLDVPAFGSLAAKRVRLRNAARATSCRPHSAWRYWNQETLLTIIWDGGGSETTTGPEGKYNPYGLYTKSEAGSIRRVLKFGMPDTTSMSAARRKLASRQSHMRSASMPARATEDPPYLTIYHTLREILVLEVRFSQLETKPFCRTGNARCRPCPWVMIADGEGPVQAWSSRTDDFPRVLGPMRSRMVVTCLSHGSL